MTLFCISLIKYSRSLLLFLIFLSSSGFAQQDQLEQLVATKEGDKISKLEEWCNKKLFFNKPADKKMLLSRLERLAVNNNDKITQACITFYRGLYLIAMDSQQHKEGIAMMKNAIAMAEKNNQQLQIGYFKHSLGYYYFTRAKNPVDALQNMLQAHYIFDEIGYNNVHNSSGLLDRIAYVYYHLGNYNESIKYLKQSLNSSMESTRRHVGILNTMGQSYRELDDRDNAFKYFHQARRLAIAAKDTAWIGISAGNIGHMYLREKSYKQAAPYMQEYYDCGVAVADEVLIAEALTGLGEISLSDGNTGLALKHLESAEGLLEKAFANVDVPIQEYVRKHYLLTVMSNTWDARGNTERALKYLKEAGRISDSVEHRTKILKAAAVRQMLEAEQANSRLQLMNEEKQAAILKQKLYIAIGVSLAIIILLLYSRQIRERKIRIQKEALLNLEKEKAENELEVSKQQLSEYIDRLQQKKELIDNIQSEIERLQKQGDIPIEDEQAALQKLNFATILTEDDWTRFRILFEKVHRGFFHNLKMAYPGLTPAETRLSSLVKLGLSSQQMAAMMGISVESIRKNRQRLRKKINIAKEQKLEDLFTAL